MSGPPYPTERAEEFGTTWDNLSRSQQAEISATSMMDPLRQGAERRLHLEDADIAKAIERSRMDYGETLLRMGFDTRGLNFIPEARKASKNQEDAIERALSNDFMALDDLAGDTLIYIGAPPRTSHQSCTEYIHIANHFNQTHRIDSRHIQAMQSEKLNKLLGPGSLIAERRLRRDGALRGVRTEGIKYYVDLRPPNEDEEAIILLTELTCTKGVLSWYKAKERYNIDESLLCGSDEFKSLLQTLVRPQPAQTIPIKNLAAPTNSGNVIDTSKDATVDSKEPQCEPKCEPEYSPLRHRSAIERLIHAMALGDPRLDSAPKVWTYFAIAKYFDCATHERISGWITRWLLNGPNSNFIQNNPEVTYRIGMGIASPGVTRIAFSILVGEKALLDLAAEQNPGVLSQDTSVHGRLLELLDDDERNRIGHAAASLVRRIQMKFNDVFGRALTWLQQSKEYQKLTAFKPRSPKEQEVIQGVLHVVHDYIRGRLSWGLCRNYDSDFFELDSTLANVHSFHPTRKEKFCQMYNDMALSQRLFTRTFWLGLVHGEPMEGNTDVWNSTVFADDLLTWAHTKAIAVVARLQKQYPEAKLVQPLRKGDLGGALRTYNELQGKHNDDDLNAYLEQQMMAIPTQTSVNEAVSHAEHNDQSVADASLLEDTKEQTARSSVDAIPLECLTVSSPKRNQTDGEASRSPEKRRRVSILHGLFNWKNDKQASASASNSPFTDPVVDNSTAIQQPVAGKTTSPPPLAPQILPESVAYFQFITKANSRKASQYLAVARGDVDLAVNRYIANGGIDLRDDYSATHVPSPGASGLENADSHQALSAIGPSKSGSEIHGSSNGLSHSDATRGMIKQQTAVAVDRKPLQSPVYSLNHRPGVRHMSEDSVPLSVETNDAQNAQPRLEPEQFPLVHHDLSKFPQVLRMDPTSSRPESSLKYWRGADGMYHTGDSDRTIGENHEGLPGSILENLRATYVDMSTLLSQASDILIRISQDILDPPHLYHGRELIPTNLVDSLMCLNDEEWKYLPLWAGGNDDGTGGVFDEVDVPNLEAGGWRGGKRGIGKVSGLGTGSSSMSDGSAFDDIGGEAVSTVDRASRDATMGHDGATLMSVSDAGTEQFMRQDELWEQVRDMNAEMEKFEAGAVGLEGNTMDDDEGGDHSTVMGAGSDVQGEMFGDADDDPDGARQPEEQADLLDHDSDMEIIDKEDL